MVTKESNTKKVQEICLHTKDLENPTKGLDPMAITFMRSAENLEPTTVPSTSSAGSLEPLTMAHASLFYGSADLRWEGPRVSGKG